jgi:hypothetical protein
MVSSEAMGDPTNTGRKPDGTFAPGNRGNPAGKPKGARHKTTVMLEKIMADGAEDVVHAMLKAAREGDVQAGKIILDRVVPVRKGRPLEIALPEVTTAAGVLRALGEVVAAMACGEVSPDEAATMAGVVAAPRAVLEAQEMERRLLALEEKLARGHRPPQEGEGDEP